MLPLICRRGHVTRNEVGAIRIFDRETLFEITAEAAERFETALARGGEEDIRIERSDAAAPQRAPRGAKPHANEGRRRPAGPKRRQPPKPAG